MTKRPRNKKFKFVNENIPEVSNTSHGVGSELELDCKVSQDSEITWYKNGGEFTGRLFGSPVVKTKRGMLILDNLQQTDSGVYSCNIKHEGIVLTRTFNVDVYKFPTSKPIIIKPPKNVTATEHSAVQLSCMFSFKKSRNFSITWFRKMEINGTVTEVMLTAETPGVSVELSGWESHLNIKKVNKGHQGR